MSHDNALSYTVNHESKFDPWEWIHGGHAYYVGCWVTESRMMWENLVSETKTRSWWQHNRLFPRFHDLLFHYVVPGHGPSGKQESESPAEVTLWPRFPVCLSSRPYDSLRLDHSVTNGSLILQSHRSSHTSLRYEVEARPGETEDRKDTGKGFQMPEIHP